MSPTLPAAAEGLPFLKVTAGGNDFILIDNRNGRLGTPDPALIVRLCHRGLGIGADGLILVEWSERADLKMSYYNRDGGAAGLCGNGLRCVARWAARSGSFPGRMTVETGAGLLRADGVSEPPSFVLPLGRLRPETRRLRLEGGRAVEGVFVGAGVPHFVVEVPDAFGAGVLADAPGLRRHADLGPAGANVDFFTPRGGGLVDVRYWERGVEGETLSSGTGSIAVAVAAAFLGRAAQPVTCRNREGLENRVTLADTPEGVEATLAGEVRFLYRGRGGGDLLA